MSHGVPNFFWRNGRPRWIASPRLRTAGFVGRDLKGEDGQWLGLEAAMTAAAEINAAAGITSTLPAPRAFKALERSKQGFIYFLLVGERIKIGFSTTPGARLQNLETGLPEDAAMYVAVRGSLADEYALHQKFSDIRLRGEWFTATTPLLNLVLRCVRLRRVTSATSAVRFGEDGTETERRRLT